MFLTKQRYKWDCGAACVANSYYLLAGRFLSLKKSRQLCGTTPADGTSDIAIVEALRALGFTDCKRMGPSHQRYAFSYLKRGDIACVDRWGHWVLIMDKLKNSVIIHDPLVGLVSVSNKNFKKRWKYQGVYFWISVK